MISFSEKWPSIILKNKILFFTHKNFWKNFRNFFSKIFIGGKKYFILQDFWKPFFRKWNHRKLINGSWDMIIFCQLQRPIFRMSVTKNKHLISLNDSTHQDLSPDIWSDEMWFQTFELLLFQKIVNLIPTDVNQFLRIKLSAKNLKKSK